MTLLLACSFYTLFVDFVVGMDVEPFRVRNP